MIVATTLASRAGAGGKRFVLLGVSAGLVYFCGTLYWLATVMSTYGGLSILVTGSLTLLLAAYRSLFCGLFTTLLGTAVRLYGTRGVWLAPAFWVSTEWLRALIGCDFPWVLLGSSQARVLPVVQLASVTGVYGLSALVALVGTGAAMLAVTTTGRHRRGVAAVLAVLVAALAFGAWRLSANELTAAGTPIRIGLLQGNVPQEQKWDPAYRDAIMERYIGLSRQAIAGNAALVMWPEAATPFYFDVDRVRAEPLRRLAAQARVPFLIGTDEVERGTNGQPDRHFVAAVLVGTDGLTKRSYRKIRLVPFGEYVPFKPLLFFVGPLVEAVSDFTKGTERVVFDAEGTRFSVAICYEAVYPGLAQEFVQGGSQLLTTITNDAWFGRSSAAYQHFEQASLRAVEQGRYLVRAANTGFSGAVDPYGRVLAQSRLFETEVVMVDVRLQNGRTIYARSGDLIVWLAIAVSFVALVNGRRRRLS